MRAGIIVFPGTNCETETHHASESFGWNTELIWHTEAGSKTNLDNFDIIILPGGYSYGDHLSAGRIAKFSPIIEKLKSYKGFILGICNGFQILTEAGFLPGALIENSSHKFISKTVELEFEGECFSLPIAHHQGKYFNEGELPIHIKQIKYKNNPNGSIADIAGLFDTKNKIMALMPHPERAVFKEQGNTDGQVIFKFVQEAINRANIA